MRRRWFWRKTGCSGWYNKYTCFSNKSCKYTSCESAWLNGRHSPLQAALCVMRVNIFCWRPRTGATPKMCPDQSQAFKDVDNSQAFTISRCSLARHVFKTFIANIRRTDCVRQKHEVIFNAQIESTLKPSNYDSKPWLWHFIAQNSKCPRRFLDIDPDFCTTCLMCPCQALYDLFFFAENNVGFRKTQISQKHNAQISAQKIIRK